MSRIFTVAEARNVFFQGLVSEWTIYEAVKRKVLPCVHIGRRVLLSEDALTEWWKQQEKSSVQVESQEHGRIRRAK